ncbi:MAG TPA: hypothetical protein DCM32_00010 [Xanthomonadaceae bacterium]|jgi:drug/metabolite transporter (DMT)-like permease|nr:hypothetical protein [Xanthomonadaceae bacterium]
MRDPASNTIPVRFHTDRALWLGGCKFTSASVAAILNASSSVFILLLAWVWLKEPLSRRARAGGALTVAGVACMLLPA